MNHADLPARPPRGYVRFSLPLARRILARVASGESLVAICAEAGMPTRGTVRRWALTLPRFAADLAKARAAAERVGTGMPLYCPAAAAESFQRLSAGEQLTAICEDPHMPAFSTVVRWRRNVPDFDEAMRIAREVQAERFCDLGWTLAAEATPETSYLTSVRLAQLRWTAAVMAPKRFRPRPQQPDEPVAPAAAPHRVVVEFIRPDGSSTPGHAEARTIPRRPSQD